MGIDVLSSMLAFVKDCFAVVGSSPLFYASFYLFFGCVGFALFNRIFKL